MFQEGNHELKIGKARFIYELTDIFIVKLVVHGREIHVFCSDQLSEYVFLHNFNNVPLRLRHDAWLVLDMILEQFAPEQIRVLRNTPEISLILDELGSRGFLPSARSTKSHVIFERVGTEFDWRPNEAIPEDFYA